MKYAKMIYTALLVSLALNFFVAGALFMHFTRPGVHQAMGGPEQFNMEAASKALSPEYRQAVDAIWRDFKDAEKPKFRRIFELRREVLEALVADEFDAEAFEDLSLKIQKSRDVVQVSLQNVLTEIALKLPAEERKRYFIAGFKENRMDPRGLPPRRPPGE